MPDFRINTGVFDLPVMPVSFSLYAHREYLAKVTGMTGIPDFRINTGVLVSNLPVMPVS